MKKWLLFSISILLIACGGSKVQSAINIEPSVYYFVRTIGGTPQAGIGETFYVKFSDPKLKIESMQLGDKQIDAEAQADGYFTATVMAPEPYLEYRSIELFGAYEGKDMEVHIQLDSVKLKEEVFMPAARPQED